MGVKASDVRYLAIQGAGGKGAAYLGALSALEETGVLDTQVIKTEQGTVKKFTQLIGISGTSAGSITALMLSLGYTASETNEMVVEFPHFSLAMGEKSDNSYYRAYKSDFKGNNAPEIGFTSFDKNLINKVKNIKSIDKYLLSDSEIEFIEDSLSFDRKGILSKILNFSFPSKAIVAGLVKSITADNSIALECITDEIVDDIYPHFVLLSRFSNLSESERTRESLEAWGFDFNLVDEMKKHLEKHRAGTQLAVGFVVLILIFWFVWFTALNYYSDNVFSLTASSGKNICSEKNQRKRDNYERWSTIKAYTRLVWNTSSNRVPLNIPIFAPLIQVIDDLNSVAMRSPKEKKQALVNLGRLVKDVKNAIDTKETADFITKKLTSEIIPTFFKPISILLENGGIIPGGRIRYLHARLIYEKVQVKGKKGSYTFQIRKRQFSPQLKHKLNNIGLDLGELKSEKKLNKEYNRLNNNFENLENNELVTTADIIKLTAEISALQNDLVVAIQSVEYEDREFIEQLELEIYKKSEEKKLAKAKDKLQNIKIVLDLFNMREYLEYIERYYSFEEHYKLFPHELTICASNLTSGGGVFFNRHLTPDFSLVEAVAASMTIPGLWRPSAIHYMPKTGGRTNGNKVGGSLDENFYKKHYYGWFVDGGLNNNTPLFAFNGRKISGGQDGELSSDAQYWGPEEVVKNNVLFPEGQIIAISNFGGYCRNKNYIGGSDAKKNKEDGDWYKDAFAGRHDLLKVASDVFSSFYQAGYKLRGFELEPYKSHILTVDYGFMGVFEFSANIEEVFRTEIHNFSYAMSFLGKSSFNTNAVIHKWKKGAKARKANFQKSKMGHRKFESKFLRFK